jgi:hypothetical protein
MGAGSIPMNMQEKLQIQELNYLYALHIDRFQIEEWVNVFTPDASFDEREFGFGLHVGHGAIREYGQQLKKDLQFLVHLMTNHTITATSDTKAQGIVFALVESLACTGAHTRFQVMYEDQYLRAEAGWKISTRVLRKTFPPEVLSTGT